MSPVSARQEALDAEQKKADATNKERGEVVGLRVRVGQTRGKNPSVITWEAFDTTAPKTLPKSVKEFVALTETKDDDTLLSYCIDGYNAQAYGEASDEIGEFINDAWDKNTQSQFRLAVRNYSKLASVSIEDAVTLIKPGLEAAFQKKQSEEANVASQVANPAATTVQTTV